MRLRVRVALLLDAIATYPKEAPVSRMPGTTWQGEQSPRNRMERYDIVCVHTIVGYAPAHAAHFSVKADGTIIQSRDTAYQSAANLNGNHRVIAIENEDHGPAFGAWGGSAVPRLTDAQVEANARILAWAHVEHGIPLQLCPNSRPGSRGLAYHRQGIDGNFGSYRFPGRVDGGEVWTLTPGKVCPGDNRIGQLPAILAAARAPTQEDDMFDQKAAEKLEQIRRDVAVLRRKSADRHKTQVRAIRQGVDRLDEAVADDATKVQVAKIREQLAELEDSLAADDTADASGDDGP